MKNPDFWAKTGPNTDQFAQKSPNSDQVCPIRTSIGGILYLYLAQKTDKRSSIMEYIGIYFTKGGPPIHFY